MRSAWYYQIVYEWHGNMLSQFACCYKAFCCCHEKLCDVLCNKKPKRIKTKAPVWVTTGFFLFCSPRLWMVIVYKEKSSHSFNKRNTSKRPLHNGLRGDVCQHTTTRITWVKSEVWKSFFSISSGVCSKWHRVFDDGDPLKESNQSISVPLMWPLLQAEPLHRDLRNNQLCNLI